MRPKVILSGCPLPDVTSVSGAGYPGSNFAPASLPLKPAALIPCVAPSGFGNMGDMVAYGVAGATKPADEKDDEAMGGQNKNLTEQIVAKFTASPAAAKTVRSLLSPPRRQC